MTRPQMEPLTNPVPVREAPNHLFNHGVWWPMRPASATMPAPMDVYADGDRYVVELALPGVHPEDIDMQLTGTTLTISGELKPAAEEGRRYLVCQRRAGTFRTVVPLPDAADSAQITATFEHGVLRLEVPRSEASRPKRIALTAAK